MGKHGAGAGREAEGVVCGEQTEPVSKDAFRCQSQDPGFRETGACPAKEKIQCQSWGPGLPCSRRGDDSSRLMVGVGMEMVTMTLVVIV